MLARERLHAVEWCDVCRLAQEVCSLSLGAFDAGASPASTIDELEAQVAELFRRRHAANKALYYEVRKPDSGEAWMAQHPVQGERYVVRQVRKELEEKSDRELLEELAELDRLRKRAATAQPPKLEEESD